MSSRARCYGLLILGALNFSPMFAGMFCGAETELSQKEADAQALRARLNQVQKQLEQEIKKRDGEIYALQQIERKTNDARKRQSDIIPRLKSAQTRAEEENQSREMLAQQLFQHQQQLASLLRQSYVARQELPDWMWGSAEQLPERQRHQQYLSILEQARAKVLSDTKNLLIEQQRIADVAAKSAEEIARLQIEASKAVSELKGSEQQRKKKLAELNQKVSTQEAELARLQKDEKTLVALLTRLHAENLGSGLADKPFSTLKTKLRWPVSGKIIHRFGEIRAGKELRWQGTVIAADRGTPVQASAGGRVLFADWLPGMGLLIILDHGEGYMSLYGYSESLQRSVGDVVQAGDVIATAGDSGGKEKTAVYFEIRQNTKPLDPTPWIGK